MKYSLKQIFATRYDPNRPRSRKIEERLIPINAVGKFLSPYPTYFYLNLGLKPDHVTFISFLFIFAGAYFLIIGKPIAAVISLLLFILHDSADGDMARVSGKTSYGSLIDSFGADIFYSIIPVSIGYFLYSIGTVVPPFMPSHLILIGAFTSISFLFYRLMNTKVLTFFWDKKGSKEKTSVFDDVSEATSPRGFFVHLAKFYHHTLIKGNFFAEPGIVTWICVFVFFEKWEWLGVYLILILLYNLGYLIPNFIRIYLSFLHYEKQKGSVPLTK